MDDKTNVTPPSDEAADREHENTAAESATEVNARNEALTTGKIGDDGRGAPFFSSADVRAMSREQVRSNLSKILTSMESPDF